MSQDVGGIQSDGYAIHVVTSRWKSSGKTWGCGGLPSGSGLGGRFWSREGPIWIRNNDIGFSGKPVRSNYKPIFIEGFSNRNIRYLEAGNTCPDRQPQNSEMTKSLHAENAGKVKS